jgi:hypothetical protein
MRLSERATVWAGRTHPHLAGVMQNGVKPSTIHRLTDTMILETLERNVPANLKPLIKELRKRLYKGRIAQEALKALQEKVED